MSTRRGASAKVMGKGTEPLILVCDDNEDILEMVRYILEGDGFRVVECHDGRRLLDLALESRPDLVLLDLRMPDLDGISILDALRSSDLKRVPVIVLSAKGMDEDREAALDAGAAEFLPKPFSVDGLISSVRRQLAKARA